MIIRRMIVQDVPGVHKLEQAIFKDAWQVETFLSEVNNPKISYPCVIEKDSIILGYVVTWSYAGEIHIGNIAVHPDYRRKGLAKKLMDHLMEKYKEGKVMYLEVRKSNQAAIGLYRKYGFKNLFVRPGYYSNGENAIVMHKDLTKKR